MEEKIVEQPKITKKQMSKKTMAFIAFLVGITVILLGFSIYTQKMQQPTPPSKPSAVVTPSYAHTTLSLTPPAKNPVLGHYTTDVFIDTNKDRVTAMQLEMTFDPKVLTNVSITPGTYFPNPVVLLKKVDQASGRISLALGIAPGQKGITGAGPVATITFDENPTAKGSTVIDFLPKTIVTSEGIVPSVLKQSTATLFFVNQPELPVPNDVNGQPNLPQ